MLELSTWKSRLTEGYEFYSLEDEKSWFAGYVVTSFALFSYFSRITVYYIILEMFRK